MLDGDETRFESCSICQRTILRGERVYDYVTADGDRERVCSLCKDQAESWEWLPADRAAALAPPAPRRRRGAALRQRLARAAERARAARAREPEAGGPASPTPPAPDSEVSPQPVSRAGRPPAASRPVSPAPPREPAPRPQPRPPETRERRLRRAVERFNASAEARMVAGLCRSLGEPAVAVRDVSRRPPLVEVTIAWELSWYRWEIELDGGGEGIRELAKGGELSELDDDERRWNASLDEEGRLHLELAAARAATVGAQAGGEGGG